MKNFLRGHFTVVLIVLALFFLGILVVYWLWGLGDIVAAVNQADKNNTGTGLTTQYDLKDAASIDYRGLLPASASSTGE